MDLNMRFELIGRVANNIKLRKELSERVELLDVFTCPPQHDFPSEGFNYLYLQTKFKDLEKCQDAIVCYGLDLVAPSAYCLQVYRGTTYFTSLTPERMCWASWALPSST